MQVVDKSAFLNFLLIVIDLFTFKIYYYDIIDII